MSWALTKSLLNTTRTHDAEHSPEDLLVADCSVVVVTHGITHFPQTPFSCGAPSSQGNLEGNSLIYDNNSECIVSGDQEISIEQVKEAEKDLSDFISKYEN